LNIGNLLDRRDFSLNFVFTAADRKTFAKDMFRINGTTVSIAAILAIRFTGRILADQEL
jgi:hypothetical protein